MKYTDLEHRALYQREELQSSPKIRRDDLASTEQSTSRVVHLYSNVNKNIPRERCNTKLNMGATGFSLGGSIPSTSLTLFLSLWKKMVCPAIWFADFRPRRAIQLADAQAAPATSNT